MNTHFASPIFSSSTARLAGVFILGLCLASPFSHLQAQEAAVLKLDALPTSLTVHNRPVSIGVAEGRTLNIAAKGGSNLFKSPAGNNTRMDAPMALFKPEGDFVLAARVSGQLKSVYDVAALVLYRNDDSWAKLCFENSVKKEATIVSVVTHSYSDDCNSMTVGDSNAFLAIAKKGLEVSLHYSRDGKTWTLVRHFRLDSTEGLQAGFAVHGSRGEGFAGSFTDIYYSTKLPENLRHLDITVASTQK